MPTTKRRYRMTFDIDVEIKDLTETPLIRERWPAGIPGELVIVEAVITREFYRAFMANPKARDAYLCQFVVSLVENGDYGTSCREIAARLGIGMDPEPLLEPMVRILRGKAGDLLRQACEQGHLMDALDSFNMAFDAKLAEVTLEELPCSDALSAGALDGGSKGP